MEQDYADAPALEAMRMKFADEMEAAVKFAIAAPYPSVDEVEQDVYA